VIHLRLVVDTNILIAAMLKDSTARKILLSTPIDFYVPEFAFEEIEEHILELSKKNKLPVGTNREVLGIIRRHLHIVKKEDIEKVYPEAEEIMKDIDVDDSACLAAALSMECDGIWSHDQHLAEQDCVRIWLIKDLVHFIE
jgi:predicted nucleic acid-binding protein